MPSVSAQNYVALTGDVWTSIATNSYLTVTAHYLDEWEMKSIVLGTLPLSESHTGVNLAGWVKDLVFDFNIETIDADTKKSSGICP